MTMKTTGSGKSEYEKLMSAYMEVWIVYVLRTFSTREHPMSRKEIADKVSELINIGTISETRQSDNTIAKTVSRRLDELEMMGNLYEGESGSHVPPAFYRVMGGAVKAIQDRPVRYYFDPILAPGEVSMICAAIESNHYLSPEEINYLIKRECAVLGYQEQELHLPVTNSASGRSLRLPKRPRSGNDLTLPPARSSVTLRKIAVIQYAIARKLMIRVIPGTYSNRDGKIVFGPKRDRESILNPYAMISQNGQYYIVVTHEGFTNPTHYRIDRLFSISLCEDENPRRKQIAGYKKREPIPVRLQRFFTGNGKFKADEYTAIYPLMIYNEGEGIKQCRFLCAKSGVTVAIDHFGVGVGVKMEETDDDSKVLFTVMADYNNVRYFCIQQNAIVSPVAPDELKDDVKQALKKAYDAI